MSRRRILFDPLLGWTQLLINLWSREDTADGALSKHISIPGTERKTRLEGIADRLRKDQTTEGQVPPRGFRQNAVAFLLRDVGS